MIKNKLIFNLYLLNTVLSRIEMYLKQSSVSGSLTFVTVELSFPSNILAVLTCSYLSLVQNIPEKKKKWRKKSLIENEQLFLNLQSE